MTAATFTEWAALRVRMCSEEESALGPLNDEDVRARCGLTAKQLRNVRGAGNSGALRQKATALGVGLPPGYVANSTAGLSADQEIAGVTA